LRRVYKGPLHYGEDAFAGLRIMDELVAKKHVASVGSFAVSRLAGARRKLEPVASGAPAVSGCRPKRAARSSIAVGRTLAPAADVPEPPFWGSKLFTDFPVEDVFQFLNE